MKEFEKWYESEATEEEKGYCMVAWKAALEWTRKETLKGLSAAGVLSMIEEELENSND